MISVPDSFQFSQSSLQDFVDCPRRFELRWLLRRAWPAVESEPYMDNERQLKLGAVFHRIAQQYLIGLPEERLTGIARESAIDGQDLVAWWENYLSFVRSGHLEGAGRWPEISLTAPFGDYRLVAKYDTIALTLSQPRPLLVIYDWKTSEHRPNRKWLEKRLQTRVYPYLLVRSGGYLNRGVPVQPEQVEMIYWFTASPDDPERFPYSAEQYQRDEEYLLSILAEIEHCAQNGSFSLCSEERRCRYCTYRSLCDRGVAAGDRDRAEGAGPEVDETEASQSAPWQDGFDFEQISEIEF